MSLSDDFLHTSYVENLVRGTHQNRDISENN